MLSTASITDATIPAVGSDGAVAPTYSGGRVSFLGDFLLMLDVNLSGTTDSFLIELEGRLVDAAGNATPWGLLASATYTADEIEHILVENNTCNQFRVVITRTGSTDTVTLAVWFTKAFLPERPTD